MNIMKQFFFFLLAGALFAGCQSEPQSDYKELDLLPYGLPVTIMAPDSTNVKSSSMGDGLMQDITVRGAEGYDLQIIASTTNSSDIAKAKAEALASVKGNRYFSKIVQEAEDGFIYEMQIDSNTLNYGFRHILLQGDKEIIFSQGMASAMSQEEATRLYEAVK